jgi:hypothetical protein
MATHSRSSASRNLKARPQVGSGQETWSLSTVLGQGAPTSSSPGEVWSKNMELICPIRLDFTKRFFLLERLEPTGPSDNTRLSRPNVRSRTDYVQLDSPMLPFTPSRILLRHCDFRTARTSCLHDRVTEAWLRRSSETLPISLRLLNCDPQ